MRDFLITYKKPILLSILVCAISGLSELYFKSNFVVSSYLFGLVSLICFFVVVIGSTKIDKSIKGFETLHKRSTTNYSVI
jgi:hypothetical protein